MSFAPRHLTALSALLSLALGAREARAQYTSQPQGSTLSSLVTVQYDSTADTTRVRTALVPVRGALKMYAGYRFAGTEPTQPEGVFLVFQEETTAPGWENPHNRTLELWVDDTTKIEVERTDYLRRAAYERGPLMMDITEWVWATLPPETFARLASAKKVEGRLGQRRFDLKKEQLETLRELAVGMPSAAAGAIEP